MSQNVTKMWRMTKLLNIAVESNQMSSNDTNNLNETVKAA